MYVQLNEHGEYLTKHSSQSLVAWDANNFCTPEALTQDGKAEQFRVYLLQPTNMPTHDPIVQSVRETTPVLTDKGHYEQQWEVYELDPAQVDENIVAAKAGLVKAATAKRWEVMTSGISLPGGMQVGTTIDDQNRITTVVANAALVGLTDESLVDFKSNSGWVQITVGQIKAIAGAIGQFVQACYSAERQHHEAIDLLVTAQELRDYDVNAGWEQPEPEPDVTPVVTPTDGE